MRTASPAYLAALDAGRVAIAGMIRFDLGQGSFGLINSASDHVHAGVTYKAFRRGILNVTAHQQITGTAAAGFTISVAENAVPGLTPDVIASWETYDYRLRRVWIGDLPVDARSGAILGDPVTRANGYINAAKHEIDPERGYILTLECESRAYDFGRTNGRIRSHQDQLRRDPTDKGLIHTATAGRVEVKWGRK